MALADDWRANIFAPPTAIVDSGNGVQMIWLLRTPLANTDENRAAVKAQAKALITATGSDAIQNLDQLLRLPFTENIPSAKKAAKGRTRQTARLLHHDPGATTSLMDLKFAAPPVAETKATVEIANFEFNEVIAAAEKSRVAASLSRSGSQPGRVQRSRLHCTGE